MGPLQTTFFVLAAWPLIGLVVWWATPETRTLIEQSAIEEGLDTGPLPIETAMLVGYMILGPLMLISLFRKPKRPG